MEVKKAHVKQLRIDKGWTQQQLADVTSLSLRTVQRVEKLGVASMESVNALCSVFDVERSDLLTENVTDALKFSQNQLSIRTKLAFLSFFLFGVLVGSVIAYLIINNP